jgi:hypothetical protein
MDNSDINTLLDELSSFKLPAPNTEAAKEEKELSEDDIKQYVLKQSKALIDVGVGTAQDVSSYAVQNQNPDDVAALAEVMSATSKLLETLNKTVLIDKKADRDEKIKKMDIEARKEIAQLKGSSNVTNNMNVLVASREEIMKKLFQNSEVLEILDK